MLEADWLSSTDPTAMLRAFNFTRDSIQGRLNPPSDRKLRLFACACWRGTFTSAADVKHALDGEEMAEGRGVRPDRPETWLTVPSALDAAQWGIEKADGVLPADQAALLREIIGNPFRPVTFDQPHIIFTDPLQRTRFVGTGIEERVQVLPLWLTQEVEALARMAYQERPGRECERCKGKGELGCSKCSGEGCSPYGIAANGPCTAGDLCPDCHGTGRTLDGSLDPHRLAILADALEEAGCTDEAILRHLHSPGPHYRGCHVLDAILGHS